MIKECYEQSVEKARDTFGEICTEYGEKFARQVGDIDTTPDRDRIFILEELLDDIRSKSDSTWMDYTRDLVNSIDEKELIARKKENTKEGA